MRQLGQARRPLIALLICIVSLTSTLLAPVIAGGVAQADKPTVPGQPVADAAPASGQAAGQPAAGQSASGQPASGQDASSAPAPSKPGATQPAATVSGARAGQAGSAPAQAQLQAQTQAKAQTQSQAQAKVASSPQNSGRIAASQSDLMLLAHLIQAEAGIEPYVGKVAVGAVVINRMMSGKFPKTLAGVVYQNNQFEPVANGTINRAPSADSIKAARDAVVGWDPTGGALYFFDYRKVTNGYLWGRPWSTTIGTHRFTF